MERKTAAGSWRPRLLLLNIVLGAVIFLLVAVGALFGERPPAVPVPARSGDLRFSQALSVPGNTTTALEVDAPPGTLRCEFTARRGTVDDGALAGTGLSAEAGRTVYYTLPDGYVMEDWITIRALDGSSRTLRRYAIEVTSGDGLHYRLREMREP